MSIDIEFIDEALITLENVYQEFLKDNDLEASASAHYALYQSALAEMQARPIEDRLTQKVLETKIRLRMQHLILDSNLAITKIPVP